MSEQALADTTVVDFTTGTDGPFATKLLADFGARVIKVESPDGDPTRGIGPFPNGERGARFPRAAQKGA
jgi:crotonobetainyl-CoA:carnitine CoA-transferase CaiB-like acyl-CoA transferase